MSARVPFAVVILNAAGVVQGQSPAVQSVVNTGAGIYDITLAPNFAIDSTQCAHSISEVGQLAASGASSFALSHTSDTVKRITALREGAAGAASALTNIACCLVLYSTLT
jgi:hypothetical protein